MNISSTLRKKVRAGGGVESSFWEENQVRKKAWGRKGTGKKEGERGRVREERREQEQRKIGA